MDPLLAAALPSLLVAALTLWVNRTQRARDAVASDRDKRIDKLEEGKHRHADELARISTTAAVLSARVDNLHQSDGDLREQISDIRDNMVRKDDLDALGKRIDDALRRGSSGQHPLPPRPRGGR